jgi:hypothetical protein
MSKPELRTDHSQVCGELATLTTRYRDLYSAIQQLDRHYDLAKKQPAPMRYGAIKQMIKDATADDVIAKTQAPRVEVKKQKGLAGLIDKAKQLADNMGGKDHGSSSKL